MANKFYIQAASLVELSQEHNAGTVKTYRFMFLPDGTVLASVEPLREEAQANLRGKGLTILGDPNGVSNASGHFPPGWAVNKNDDQHGALVKIFKATGNDFFNPDL